jgi:hypothetical protein
MDRLDFVFYWAAAISLGALPFLLVNWIRYWKARSATGSDVARIPAKFPIKSVIFFLLPMLIGSAIANFMTTSARGEALTFIAKLSGRYTVDVNERPVANADEIVSALKEIAPYWAHHTAPTKTIRVDIHSDRGDLTLELRRDSGNPREYWVFQPKHGVTLNNEIGRITTSVFDEY